MTQEEIRKRYALLQRRIRAEEKKLEKLRQQCKHPDEEGLLFGNRAKCRDCGNFRSI